MQGFKSVGSAQMRPFKSRCAAPLAGLKSASLLGSQSCFKRRSSHVTRCHGRICEAICDYADCLCELTPTWPSRALSQEDIKLWARLGRHAHVAGRLDNDLVIELHQITRSASKANPIKFHDSVALI